MAVQKKINLNEPLDPKKAPSLTSFDLTPEYTEAALVLHGDRFCQLQSTLIRNAYWNAGTVSVIVLAFATFFFYQLQDYIAVSDSLGEFFRLIRRSRDLRSELIMTFPFMLSLIGIVGLVGFLFAREFKIISNRLVEQKYYEHVFGFDVLKFAKLDPTSKNPKDVKLLEHGKNTHLIEFRDQAIGVITLKPLVDNSTDANFYIRITGPSMRRMFKQFDFDQLLLDWALQRAKELYKQHNVAKKLTNTAGCKITLLVDNYSFDRASTKFWESNQFRKVGTAYNFNPLNERTGVLNNTGLKLFGLTKDAYAIHLVDTGSS